MEGPLYVKIESKKVWKRYHFALRASGIYYYPKDKPKSPRDLLCHSVFTDCEVYKGIGWKKKHKAPTDYTFALKSRIECTGIDTQTIQRNIKMLCAEDNESLDLWTTVIRVAMYGKRLLDNHRILIEDLAREELDKFSSNRSDTFGIMVSSVTSQSSRNTSIKARNNNNNRELDTPNYHSSRASSSSSSGCLSDENNGFDSDFPTGTIKRKPSMKPNLPLTSVTRQLKEVGENTLTNDLNSISPERNGTLTRRNSRRRSGEGGGGNSNNSTLKRRPTSTRSSNETTKSTITTTTSIPCIPIATIDQPHYIIINNAKNNNNTLAYPKSPLEVMPPYMTESTFSLPPPPEENDSFGGSILSLDTFPPPPTPSELMMSSLQISAMNLIPAHTEDSSINNNSPCNKNHNIVKTLDSDECDSIDLTNDRESDNLTHSLQLISRNLVKPSNKAPTYKSPQPHHGEIVMSKSPHFTHPGKTVTFADSPVLLRRIKKSEDDVIHSQLNQLQLPRGLTEPNNIDVPMLPPRDESTYLTTPTSPKRLSDSVSNPPRDFLRDLQRVMRKKWQVAQKCKLEPATTPHEVLGFRDFASAAVAAASGVDSRDTSHFYRETSNVSNWVQEHYGNLYENLGTGTNVKKRRPPPPPKRSTTTQLTKMYRH